ncbi:MAG TPA: MFS transporter [Planctomycetota bacterium]|nr:MFS transporter [Planctomycetota bacterium]
MPPELDARQQPLPEISDAKRRRALLFVGLAVGAVAFALALQIGLCDNFVVGELDLKGFHKGVLEAVRESCGIVSLGILALLAGVAEPLLGVAMLVLFAVGLGSYAFIPDFRWLLIASVVWSQGLHVWMPLPDSMALSLAEPGRRGFRLGQVRSAGAAGFGLGIGAALALTLLGVRMRPMFLVAGAFGLLAAAMCFGIPRDLKTPGPRLVFRRRYGLYYLLSFLDGWRRQIFLCFAGFLLVREYGTRLEIILLLLGTVQVISYFTMPWVGRLIDRVGERRILVFYFACMTLIFVGYAFIRVRYALYVLYVVDNSFAALAAALTVYVGRIAPPSEHTPTLGMGVAMNHVSAVLMPLLGGLLWQHFGYQWTFLAGVAAALVSIAVASRVPPKGEG